MRSSEARYRGRLAAGARRRPPSIRRDERCTRVGSKVQDRLAGSNQMGAISGSLADHLSGPIAGHVAIGLDVEELRGTYA